MQPEIAVEMPSAAVQNCMGDVQSQGTPCTHKLDVKGDPPNRFDSHTDGETPWVDTFHTLDAKSTFRSLTPVRGSQWTRRIRRQVASKWG